MADTATGVVSLIVDILHVVREVQKAKESMRDTPKTLAAIAYQLDSTSKSLVLVQNEASLQTPSVEQQLTAIFTVAEELRAFFYRLQAFQRQRAVRRFAHAIKSGGGDDSNLASILMRLDRARNELILRISVAQVGLMGSLNEGFRVSNDVLMDTNRKCKMILGRDLALANHLKGRRVQRDGRIPLDRKDVQRLHLSNPANIPRRTHVMMNENVTLGKARIAAGDIGCSGSERPGKSVGVSRNQFAGDLRMMVGDVQGSPSTGFFNSKFWS